jgi:parallel beta-helix repeat protein
MKSIATMGKRSTNSVLTLFATTVIMICILVSNSFAGNVSLCSSVQDCIDEEIDYLIIVAETLKEGDATYFNKHVDALAEHRSDYLDLNVGIVNTISLDSLEAWEIRKFIRDVYESNSAAHMADGNLGFVLLVGDKQDDDMNEFMIPPHYYWTDFQGPSSDHWYACVTHEGSDYDDYPDLMIGRLSVGTAQDDSGFVELRGAVNKTIEYDFLASDGWKDNILLIGSAEGEQYPHQYSDLLDTLKEIIPDDYTIDEIKEWEGWSADSINAAIISAMNDGRWVVTFGGHGAQTYWKYRSGGVSVLSVDDLEYLTNKDEYPMMFADACKTGWFDNTALKPDDCVGEEFVNADTCGAIAYLGASRTAYFPGGAILIESAHRALFHDHAYFTGEMIAAGKIAYLSKRDKSLIHNSAHKFNLFGDPAVNLMWSVSDSTELPDLVVSQSGITISPISGNGDSLVLSAVVENKGPEAVTDTFSVLFFKGDPALGDTIGSKHKVPSLSAWYGSETLSDTVCVDSLSMWREKIYVVADCDSEIVEIYEDNNTNWNWNSLYLFNVTELGTSSPAIANVVGDSDPEVIIAGNCWGKDGEAWSFSKDDTVVSSPAVGDIDDDGDQEVVLVFNNDSLFVYVDSTQEYAWGSGDSNTKIYGNAALAYLDDNDTLDIVFGLSSSDGAQDTNRVIALQAQGDSLKTLWIKVINTDNTAGAILSPPAIGDVDSDGKSEVIVFSEDGFASALNGENGNTVWTSQVGVNSASAPILADKYNDGTLEIICRSQGDTLYVLKGEDGQKVFGLGHRWEIGPVNRDRSPCFGDIDGDGSLEVVLQADSLVYVLSIGGSEDSLKVPTAHTGVLSPVLVDLNGDSSSEIIIAAGDSLYIIDGQSLYINQKIPLAAEATSSPAVGDIDGDGDVEIICSCQADSKGIIHVYDHIAPTGQIDWGMYQHDPHRTGCYAQPVSGTITEDLRWSGNVFISGDVIIPDSVKLTILPDSHVEFDTTDSEISGEDTTKCELIVYGQLHAVGTDGHGIEFTSHAYPPATSDWYAISLWDTASNSSQIEYCDINYAYKGISCYQCSIDVLNSSISHCSYGAYVDSSGTKLLLDHVRVDSCSYGVHVHQGAVRLDSSEFKYNDYGVKCEDFTRYDENMSDHYPDFRYCEIDSNNEAGVLLDDSSPIINNCSMSYNKIGGIQCLGASDPILGQNTLTDNSGVIPPMICGTGLHATGTSSPIVSDKLFPYGCEYQGGYNVITNNRVTGVLIQQNSYPRLGKSMIEKGQNSGAYTKLGVKNML